MSFNRRGNGAPVVMVHGLGSRWQVFEPTIETLASSHEVIAIDLPGFGDAPVEADVRPGPSGYADWLARWLDAHDIHRPHVVGSSMGGAVALELGRAGLAGAVTAFSPVGFYRTPGRVWVQRFLTGVRSLSKVAEPAVSRALDHRLSRSALLAPLFGRPGQVAPDAAKADVAALVSAPAFTAARDSFSDYVLDADDDMGGLTDIQVTIAWGKRDVLLLHRTQSARAREVLPFAHHVDLPGCGHLPFADDPALCVKVIQSTAARSEVGA